MVRPTTVTSAFSARRAALQRAARRLFSVGLAMVPFFTSIGHPAAALSDRPRIPDFWPPVGEVWQIAFDAIPVGPAAFDGAHAYVGLRDGRLAAVSLTSGARRWTTTAGITAPPAAFDGLVVAIKDATLVGVDGATGKTRWQQGLDASSRFPPSVGATWIAAVTAKPELVVLNPASGAIMWRRPLVAQSTARPVGDADRVIVGLASGQVIAFSTRTGSPQWTRKIGGEPLALTLHKDRLFVGGSDNYLCALVAETGRQKWKWRTGGDVAGVVAADDKRVYFASLDNSLVALGRGRGDMKWEQRLPSRPVGGPVLLGNTIILATVAKELKTFDFERGTLLETVSLPGRPLHQPYMTAWSGLVPPRAVVLMGGGELCAVGPVVEPPLEPLDPMPGKLLPPEALDPIEPPLVPMLYPPGRLLAPETLPAGIIKKQPSAQP